MPLVSRRRFLGAVGVWSAFGPTSRVGAADTRRGWRVRVLGTAQDGGLPHAGCTCTRCQAARKDERRARLVSSLAVLSPAGRAYLVDASPDLPRQLEVLRRWRGRPAGGTDRAPCDGVLLTHAHLGHYLGLAYLGLEALHTRGLALHVSPRLAAFLKANGPWSQLVAQGNVELREWVLGRGQTLEPGFEVTPFQVPHRDELSDTLAYVLRGPRRALLYVPDTDAWELWPVPLEQHIKGVDIALLDGTFYSGTELPDRDLSQVRHPFMTATMERLAPWARRGHDLRFIHLNHTNPAADRGAPERHALEARGFRVAEDGDELEL